MNALTKEEKRIDRQERKAWNEMMSRMQERGAIVSAEDGGDEDEDLETTDNGPTGHGDICHSDADPGL